MSKNIMVKKTFIYKDVLSGNFNKGEFEWKINISSGEILDSDDYLYSQKFSFSSSSWIFVLCPKGENASNNEWMSLYLKSKELVAEKFVKIEVCMIIAGVMLTARETPYLFRASNQLGGWKQFVLRQDVFDLRSVAPENCNVLDIRVKLRNFIPCDEVTLPEESKTDIEILCQNYKDLLLHEEDHDLILKVRDKHFKAHRIIMQCRCPVFKSMLILDMLEKNSGVVEIPDCDPNAFEQFLSYVYAGDLETLDESNMLGLYYIADKYNMAFLKEKCREFIKESLSTHVICDVIRLALNHNDFSLLKHATDYFVNNVKEILFTVEWQSFIKENPVEANELFIKTFS